MFYRLSTSHIPSVFYAFAKINDAIEDNVEGKFILQKFNEQFYNNSLKELDFIMYEDVQSSSIVLCDLEKVSDENTCTNIRNSNYNYASTISEEEMFTFILKYQIY